MAAKLGFEAIQYVLKKALTKKGVKGIPTIPGPAYNMQMKQLVDEMAKKMSGMGYDVNKVTEKQVKGLLDYAEAMEKQKLKNIHSRFFDPSGKMKPEGEDIVKKGLEGLGKKPPFQGMTPRVQQDVDGIIKNLKSMEPVDAMKVANLIIGRKGQYKNLSIEESQRILKETDDHIFQRDIKPDPEDLASGGIAGPLHLYDGGRAGFKKGGFDPSKRKFLKGTGATLGVLSMLPFVGKFFKPVAKTVGKFKGTPNLVVDITKTPNMPEWYIPLIKKVLNKGDEVTDKAATAARERVHRDILPDGDEVTVTQNIDNQTISVNVVNPKDNYFSASGAGEQPYTIQYSKGKVIEDGKYKGQKEADTLEVDEPVLHRSGPEPDDVEIDAEVVNYNPKAEVHDTSVLESYATGKKVKSRGSGEVYDPYEGYSPDLKADKAEGGRVSLSKGGLAHVLGV